MTLVPTEAQEAQTLVHYLRLSGHRFHHSPNETGSSMEARRRAVRMKREGTSPGFPDYLVIVNKKLVFIELKRVKGSKVSIHQKEWIADLLETGVVAAICYGAEEAIGLVEGVASLGVGDGQ